jgi:gamma-glutamylcyclotransferase (GGCT)/AIG2-like uncharacterized protein YtfP
MLHPEAVDYYHFVKEDNVVKLPNKTQVFVYGTLRTNQHNAHLLYTSEKLGLAQTIDKFMMFNVGFPLCRLVNEGEEGHHNGGFIKGEVYEVSDEVLAKLDRLEGHPNFYKRTPTDVVPCYKRAGWEKQMIVHMYHWNEPEGTVEEGVCTPKDGVLDWIVSRWNSERRVG